MRYKGRSIATNKDNCHCAISASFFYFIFRETAMKNLSKAFLHRLRIASSSSGCWLSVQTSPIHAGLWSSALNGLDESQRSTLHRYGEGENNTVLLVLVIDAFIECDDHLCCRLRCRRTRRRDKAYRWSCLCLTETRVASQSPRFPSSTTSLRTCLTHGTVRHDATHQRYTNRSESTWIE